MVSTDISDFLQRQIKDGALKANALQQANRLIDRSRRQIEKIEAVVPRPKEEDDYVIMNNAGNTEEDHYVQPDCIKNGNRGTIVFHNFLKSSNSTFQT